MSLQKLLYVCTVLGIAAQEVGGVYLFANGVSTGSNTQVVCGAALIMVAQIRQAFSR